MRRLVAVCGVGMLLLWGCGSDDDSSSSGSDTGSASEEAGDDDESSGPASTDDLLEAGLLTDDDLPDAGDFEGWDEVESDSVGINETLNEECAQLSLLVPTGSGSDEAENPEEEESSDLFDGSFDSVTTISLSARNEVAVYEDDDAAAEAFELVDWEEWAECLTDLVQTEADDAELGIDAGDFVDEPDIDADDDRITYEVGLPEEAFGGYDNSNEYGVIVALSGRVVLIFGLTTSGQDLSDVSISDLEEEIVDPIVERVDDAQG